MPKTKIILMESGSNDPNKIEILYTALNQKQLMKMIKLLESQLQEGGK